MNEGGGVKHINNRQQMPSQYQETDNGLKGDSLKGHVRDGRVSVSRQDASAGSAWQELESTDRYKKKWIRNFQ